MSSVHFNIFALPWQAPGSAHAQTCMRPAGPQPALMAEKAVEDGRAALIAARSRARDRVAEATKAWVEFCTESQVGSESLAGISQGEGAPCSEDSTFRAGHTEEKCSSFGYEADDHTAGYWQSGSAHIASGLLPPRGSDRRDLVGSGGSMRQLFQGAEDAEECQHVCDDEEDNEEAELRRAASHALFGRASTSRSDRFSRSCLSRLGWPLPSGHSGSELDEERSECSPTSERLWSGRVAEFPLLGLELRRAGAAAAVPLFGSPYYRY